MRFKTIAVAGALATLASATFAQAYVGVGLGDSHTCSIDIVAQACGATNGAAKVLAGYEFPGTSFAIEGAYTHFGSLRLSSYQGRVDLRGDTFGVGGAWRPQFGAGFGGVARAGIAWGTIRTSDSENNFDTPPTTTDFSHASNTWLPTFGLGATYALTSAVQLEADWDFARLKARPGSVPSDDFNTWTLGATFHF